MVSWQNGKLAKWQVGEMASWKNGQLSKWQVGEMASWQNGKLAKWPNTLFNFTDHKSIGHLAVTIMNRFVKVPSQ